MAGRLLDGRIVVVTGGNGGIGLGIAGAAGEAGGRVIIWARNEAKSAKAVTSLQARGIDASSVSCDVADEASVDLAMVCTLERFERVDCLVANAAISGITTSLVDMTLTNWRQVIDTNLTGVMLSFRAASRQMIRQGQPGSLVAVSSIITRFGGAGRSHYAAAKTGVHALVMSAAVELARYGIRCNSLSPGWTQTELLDQSFVPADRERYEQAIIARTPVRRWGSNDDFAAAAVLLLDPTQSYHTGDMITVDGGYTIY